MIHIEIGKAEKLENLSMDIPSLREREWQSRFRFQLPRKRQRRKRRERKKSYGLL